MSTSKIVPLRAMHGRCLHRLPTGIASLTVASRSSRLVASAALLVSPSWQRHQSTSRDQERRQDSSTSKQQKITFRQFAGRALGAGLRNLAFALSPKGIRQAYRDSPGSTSFAVFLLLLTGAISFVALRSFYLTFYGSAFSKYPEPVANTLRKAIYYSNYKPDPELALKYYKKAMQQCAEVGLDPFSDEVLGIRIQVSAWLQKLENHSAAVEVLESVFSDCQKWISVMEKSVEDGQVDKKGYYIDTSNLAETKQHESQPDRETTTPGNNSEDREGMVRKETLWHKRERLLAKAVKTAVALGELYADEHVLKPEKATEHFTWAVETALKEFKRRRTEGTNPGEQTWLTAAEIGGAMESLGRDYERKSQFHLAIPLFFQALRLCEVPCHRAVVMNNLAACFAQVPDSILSSSLSDGLRHLDNAEMPKTRSGCLEAAANWAENAYMHGTDVKGEERTAECDEACAVALCNWGDVMALLGKASMAKKKYQQCIEMSNKLGFADGEAQATEGLARLDKSTN